VITGAPVTVGIVTWNSAACLESCLASVRAQTHRPVDLLVVDNHSADGTRPLLERLTAPGERVQLDRNTGFSSAHNLAIRRTRGTYYLALNPDVVLAPDFVSALAHTLDAEPHAGAATGKLRLADEPARLDSTGIVMVPEQRHFDRGQGQVDRGQYDRTEPVFGASGAAAFLRREMLDDVAIEGEVFDEDFFAYREDVDLAWRAQWRGWRCLYVPSATALHARRVRPGQRTGLPAAINRHSVRNRFLLRLKNQTPGQAARFLVPALLRDLQVAAYCLLREQSSLPAFVEVARLLPRILRKRRIIMAGRRVAPAEIDRWFVPS